ICANVLTRRATQRSGKTVAESERAAGDLVRQRRVSVAISLTLGIGRDRLRAGVNGEVGSNIRQSVVGAQTQRALQDRICANVLTRRATQRSGKTVAESERAAGDLVRQRRVSVAISLTLGIGC